MCEDIEIDSLVSFMEKIESLRTTDNDFLYRGEAKDFEETKLTASVYRHIKENKKSYDEIVQLRKQYYRQIGYSLGDDDVANFISYAQHHGLPTELIDVTENPLVALYFACENYNDDKEKDAEDDGFVYLLKLNDTVDIGRLLVNNDIELQQLDFNNEFDKLEQSFFNGTRIFEENENLLVTLMPNIEYWWEDTLLPSLQGDRKLSLNRIVNVDKHIDQISILMSIIGRFNNSDRTKANLDTLVNESYSLLYPPKNFDDLEFLKALASYPARFRKYFLCYLAISFVLRCLLIQDEIDISNLESYLPIKCYLIHQPSVIFDRMKNQQGIFIYQMYMSDETDLKRSVVQKITPHVTLRIKKKSKKVILQQLDTIGINEKFIYPDPDHIANYVKTKW